MSYPQLVHGDMVTIKNRVVSGTDEFGNDVFTYTEQTVGPCSVQPSTSRESVGQPADQVVTGMVVFMPYGTQIGYLDAFIVDGVEYEVQAEPETWASPFSGHTAPVRVMGNLVKGASP